MKMSESMCWQCGLSLLALSRHPQNHHQHHHSRVHHSQLLVVRASLWSMAMLCKMQHPATMVQTLSDLIRISERKT